MREWFVQLGMSERRVAEVYSESVESCQEEPRHFFREFAITERNAPVAAIGQRSLSVRPTIVQCRSVVCVTHSGGRPSSFRISRTSSTVRAACSES